MSFWYFLDYYDIIDISMILLWYYIYTIYIIDIII